VSDEQHMALPHLYGGPAYSRPPRPTAEIPRPFDPDELPLEAERSDEDAEWAEQLAGNAWAPASAPKAKGRRRGAKSAKSAAPASGSSGLVGRPFRLRGLGRLFRSDNK
jgi:hypothetical protein